MTMFIANVTGVEDSVQKQKRPPLCRDGPFYNATLTHQLTKSVCSSHHGPLFSG